MHDWTIVTVTYNSRRFLDTWTPVGNMPWNWIVVDNCSTDDSVETAKDLGAKVIALDENRGFSAANNVALQQVQSDFVMFVNPDVTVSSSGWEVLADSADELNCLVAPKLTNPDGSPQENARGLPFFASKVRNRGIRLPWVDPREYTRLEIQERTWIAWAMGAAVGGRTELVRSLGGWDERYFLYYEDHDLGLRSWLAGHGVVIEPRVVWTHGWQRATARPDLRAWRLELRSMLEFYREYPDLLKRRESVSPRFLEVSEALWTPA